MVPAYRFSQKFLHWLMSVIIIVMLLGGFFMTEIPVNLKPTVYMLHKSFGFLILILIPIRLALRFVFPPHSVAIALNDFHKFIKKISVPILYLMMLTMALSGFVMTYAGGYEINFFGLFDIPSFMEKSHDFSKIIKKIHKTGAIGALVIVGFHILAALYHHFYIKDGCLKSMLKSK